MEIRNRCNIKESDFVFGYIARLTAEKGHVYLLNAFKKLTESKSTQNNDFYLIIAGGGVLEDSLKEMAKNLGIDKNVIFTGRFDQEDLVKFYSTFDVFVFPSLAEGFGLVLIEAMYSQVPVICSDLPVLKEVASDTVEYFTTSDTEAMFTKMTDLYNKKSSEEVLEKVKSAKKRVEELYTLEKFIDNYINLYESFLK